MAEEKPLMLTSMERMTVRQALEGFREGVEVTHLAGRMSDEGHESVTARIFGVLSKLERLDA
ncbi:hypothetical protein [Streptomyces hydrogenans]|uniref:hypothetical protein n=1 Tax=Streptomyces hydrogenans TaxID=1873719 RepID=UPI0035DED331